MSYLYLDESGQFKGQKSRRSIVGGIFSKHKNITDSAVRAFFKQFGYDNTPFHGKELDNATLSKIIDALINFCKTNEFEPVIFIPRRDFFVINDVVTYINVLTDSVAKFLIKKAQLINDITIVIEHRVNLLEDSYKERINEAIAKTVALYGSINKHITCDVYIQNKDNVFLQIADAIVHTFYRLDVSYDSDDTEFDENVKQKFKQWIEPYKIYIHGASSPSEKIKDMIADGDYIQAVMYIANYQKKYKDVQKIIPSIIERLCQLNVLHLNTILYSVLALCYDNVNVKRLLDDFEIYVIFLLKNFLPELQNKLSQYHKQPEDIQWAFCYCYMILLTLYNHKGDPRSFEQIYTQAQQYIASSTFDFDFLSARLRIPILYGVHLTNQFDFEKAYDVMSTLQRKIEDAFAFINESDENLTVKPRIIAEIIGTGLQALMYKTLQYNGNWDEVRELSNKAIDSFEYSEDIKRQYQYRVQIETYAGDSQQARMYLAKSVGIEYTSDAELLETILKLEREGAFPLLHFLRMYYVDVMKEPDTHVKHYYEIVTAAIAKYASSFQQIIRINAYPLHSILHYLMIVYMLNNSNASRKEATEYYQKAQDLCKRNNAITIKTIEISLEADYLWSQLYIDSKDVIKNKDNIMKKFDKLIKLSEGMTVHSYITKAKEKFETTPVEKWNTLWNMFPY